MTVFDLGLTEKEIDGADAIDIGNRDLIALVVSEMKKTGRTKTDIAQHLGIHRSTVTRFLRGDQNLTLRTIGEIAGALDHDLKRIVFSPRYAGNTGIETDISMARSTSGSSVKLSEFSSSEK